jgi:signal transduction histidine kinase
MEKTIHSLKPFAAWVTGLTDSYRFNPFVKTTVNVILLEIILICFKIGVFWWALDYAQSATVSTISNHVALAVHGTASAPGSLAADINHVRNQTLAYAFAGLVALTTIFSFVTARFALRPTRNSLQFQKRFIGNVAHEIRTPMAIIKTNTEVGLMDPHLPKDVRETYEETIRELDRMSETINNLLTFDNLVRPERMKSITVDMGAVAATVVGRHQELAQSRGVVLSLTTGDYTLVHGNGTALEQVVTNLVKNAVNYTPKDKDGRVDVSVESDQIGHVIVTVADTGIGIAQKDLYHIFEPFYRADSSRARNTGTGSSGLGLAIVNEIVRIHHGSISIRSALGHGTTIRVTLPRAKDVVESAATAPLSNEGDSHEFSIDHSAN